MQFHDGAQYITVRICIAASVGAAIGALASSITYAATTPHFNLGKFFVSSAAGAISGAISGALGAHGVLGALYLADNLIGFLEKTGLQVLISEASDVAKKLVLGQKITPVGLLATAGATVVTSFLTTLEGKLLKPDAKDAAAAKKDLLTQVSEESQARIGNQLASYYLDRSDHPRPITNDALAPGYTGLASFRLKLEPAGACPLDRPQLGITPRETVERRSDSAEAIGGSASELYPSPVPRR